MDKKRKVRLEYNRVMTLKTNKNAKILKEILESDIKRIEETMEQTDPQAFSAAVDMIAKAKKIYIIGVRNCAPLAEFLWSGLHMMFENAVLIRTNSSSDMFEQLVHVNEKDVVIGISFPRYSVRTLKALEFANNRNAKVITLTNGINSPIALYSSCNLIAKSEMLSVADSFVAPMSVVNALISALCMKKRDKVIQTMESMYQIWDEYQVYGSDELEHTVEEICLKSEGERHE